MADEKRAGRHTLIMDQRERLNMTGMIDVISFDEEMIVAETEKGVIEIKGLNLHVIKLNLENGELEVEGEISGVNYEEDGGPRRGKGSLLGKIFR